MGQEWVKNEVSTYTIDQIKLDFHQGFVKRKPAVETISVFFPGVQGSSDPKWTPLISMWERSDPGLACVRVVCAKNFFTSDWLTL